MTKEQKHANFKRISVKRQQQAITAISNLSNLANESYYTYDWKELEQLLEPIYNELETARLILKKQKQRKERFTLK